MRRAFTVAAVGAVLSIALFPAVALATRATGRVSNGYYWLLTDNNRWQCRSTTDGRIQKHQKCRDAGAVKPKPGQFLR